ncbi:MAG: GNAT family N-acetyltransferase [Candidatus Eisenbacteria bacterium]|uniref:GNAT family N-acetyltransferase n=1 Tax=Eiseniibacteriota bacterium TaxID=2212470 RepID=A0A948RYS0_UNCEI|nr:GNAT family N-acetyltransferase [Candidatus Eisenbacteria bacterium]MBU2693315.1 GNAT family N-acetyltransferase [Candidatus Eisenbacteria bacterium]
MQGKDEKIRYTDSTMGIRGEDLVGFFQGWPHPPTSETHLLLLNQSDEAVLAIEEKTGRVVGFITAVTDGVLSAYIPLLEVLPAYRRRGIGGELVRRMIDKLAGLYMIDLICDREMQAFYEPQGMKPAEGMMIRHYECQSGRVNK